MAKLEGVSHYVQGVGGPGSGKAGSEGRFPFVTIERQAGAGGHTLARALLKRLEGCKGESLLEGWHVFDRELCEQIIKDKKISVTLDSLLSEEFHNSAQDLFRNVIAGTTPQEAVYGRMFKTIRTLAALGKAVIVGRGGVHASRGFPQGIHVLLVAPKKIRVKWMAEAFSLDRDAAEKKLDDQDASRVRLANSFFDADIWSPLHYDAVWNTDRVAMDTIVEALLQMIKLRARRVGAAAS